MVLLPPKQPETFIIEGHSTIFSQQSDPCTNRMAVSETDGIKSHMCLLFSLFQSQGYVRYTYPNRGFHEPTINPSAAVKGTGHFVTFPRSTWTNHGAVTFLLGGKPFKLGMLGAKKRLQAGGFQGIKSNL